RIVRENVMGFGVYLAKMFRESRPLILMWVAFLSLAVGSLLLAGNMRLFILILVVSGIAVGFSVLKTEKSDEGFHLMDVFSHLRKGHSHDLWKELDAVGRTVVGVGKNALYYSKLCKSDALKVFKIDYEAIGEIDSC